MPLAPGTKLGPYEIVSALGAGGMGEVYRAKDTRLGRDVAIKILPKEMSADSARKQRFEREASSIAKPVVGPSQAPRNASASLLIAGRGT